MVPRYEKVSVPEVNVLKSSSTLAVPIPINISIKLSFVSVNGAGETYFVEALPTTSQMLEAGEVNFG